MYTTTFRYLIAVLATAVLPVFSTAQSCECTTIDVLNNTVESCQATVGDVFTVSTTAELRAAIAEANRTGGNMTILIAAGSYQIASPSSYPYLTASNLVIRSASGERDDVIITGSGMRSVSPGTEMGFFAVGDNITIADLTIRGIGNHGIAASGDNLTVHNVRIQDTYEQLLKGVSSNGGADNARVTCTLFEYTAGIGPQWYIGGIDAHDADGWVVSDNVFRDIASPSRSAAEHGVHLWRGSTDNLIERNLIIDCDRGIGLGLGEESNPDRMSSGVIRNNMITNLTDDPFADVGIGLESAPNSEVYHNSVYLANYQNAIEYRFGVTTGVVIANNATNKLIRNRNGAAGDVYSNVTDASRDWFVDLPAGNLRLTDVATDLIDQAQSIPSPVAMDIDKTLRPQGGVADIGAHEFASGTSSVTSMGDEQVRAYPLPFSDELRLEVPVGTAYSLTDMSGRVLLEGRMSGGPIATGSLAAGSYVLRAGSSRRIVVKQR